MRGGMAHACETLEQRGFLACRQRPAVKCSLLVRYPSKNQDPLFLLDYSKDRHSTDRESGDHSAVGKVIAKLSFQDRTYTFSEETSLGSSKENLVQGTDSKARQGRMAQGSDHDLIVILS